MRTLAGWIFVALALLALIGCTPSGAQEKDTNTLTVLAASSLNEPFQKIAAEFERQNPGWRVQLSFAGSQQLAQQLVNNAPGDVFASANRSQMDVVLQSLQMEPAIDVVFTRNRLVIVIPASNPGQIDRLEDLSRPGIKVILAARDVPAGQYSLDLLGKIAANPAFDPEFAGRVIQNVVSYENNVRAVLTKIELAEADAGIVYYSDLALLNPGRVSRVEIPENLNISADYYIAVLPGHPRQQQAQTFIDLVLSPIGQEILSSYGFTP